MQNPTAVGSSGYIGSFAANARATRSGSAGTAAARHSSGNEQISALFENGVIVAMRGSDAAQRSIRSSQPAVVTVSEFSSSTSPAQRPNAAFTVPTKPRLSRWRTTRSRHGGSRSSSSSSAPTAGSFDASSTSSTRASRGSVRRRLAMQSRSAAKPSWIGTTMVGCVTRRRRRASDGPASARPIRAWCRVR